MMDGSDNDVDRRVAKRYGKPVAALAVLVFVLGLASVVYAEVRADDPQRGDASRLSVSDSEAEVEAQIEEIIASDRLMVRDDHDTGEIVGWRRYSERADLAADGMPVYERIEVYDLETDELVGHYFQGYGYVSPEQEAEPGFDIDVLAQKAFGRDALEVFRWNVEADAADGPPVGE
jgi:hypothetical protein